MVELSRTAEVLFAIYLYLPAKSLPIGGESSPIKILTVSSVFPREHDAKIKSDYQKLLPENGSGESAEETRNAKNWRR